MQLLQIAFEAIQLIYKESLLVVYAKKSKQFLGLRNFCLYECIVLITIICPTYKVLYQGIPRNRCK